MVQAPNLQVILISYAYLMPRTQLIDKSSRPLIPKIRLPQVKCV